MLNIGEKADSFMSMEKVWTEEHHHAVWHGVMNEYFKVIDELPHHYHNHLMHGAQILGYKHPDKSTVRLAWNMFYHRCCDDAHLMPETEGQMDRRLSDWEQENWS